NRAGSLTKATAGCQGNREANRARDRAQRGPARPRRVRKSARVASVGRLERLDLIRKNEQAHSGIEVDVDQPTSEILARRPHGTARRAVEHSASMVDRSSHLAALAEGEFV